MKSKCKYSIAGSVMEEGVASTLYAGSLKHSGSFTCVMAIRMNASVRCGCFVVISWSVKRRQNDGVIMAIYTKRIWSFFPVARANFFSVANDGPLTPEARLLSILVMAVALVPMRSATSAWVRPASLRAASISSSSANSSAMASYSAFTAGLDSIFRTISSCVMVGGVRLPVMFNLLHSGFSFFKFGWRGFLRFLHEAVQHDDAFAFHCAVKNTPNTFRPLKANFEQTVTECFSMRGTKICTIDTHFFCVSDVSCLQATWQRKDLCFNFFAVVLNSVVHNSEHNKVVMFAQYIDSAIPGRYTVQAPYKAGAGRENPELITEHNRAHAVFSCHEHCYAQIMVGRTGPTLVGPGSVVSGFSPLYVSPPIAVRSFGGEFSKKLTTGAVTMTTTTTHPFLKIETVNGKAVIFSLHVACHFKRMHQNIVDKIEYLNCSREFFTRNFIPGTYHVYGDSLRGYYITLDGLMMLQLGLSLRTMRYYESCIEVFRATEESLNLPSSHRYHQEARHV